MSSTEYIDSTPRANARIEVLEQVVDGYRRDLAELNAELAAALGAALVALDDPQLAVAQLYTLLADVKRAATEQDYRLAPQWRLVEAVLARQMPNPSGDETDGGAR